MKWLIIIVMAKAQPIQIPVLEFQTRNECVSYVNNPLNSDRLAVEVIAKAGFNDEIIQVACLPKANDIIEREFKS